MGCLWRSGKSRLVGAIRDATSSTERVELKPSNITSVHAWNAWVKSRTSKAFQEKSDWYRGLRRAQIPHTTSRKGMHRPAHEMVNRSKVWIAGHTHSDGRPVRPEFADTFEQIQTLDSQMDSTSGDNVRENAVSKILGKDKPGRLRGMGRGITATKLAFVQARDSRIEELQTEVQDLKKFFRDLAGNNGNPGDMASQNEVGDLNRGVKCQILAWYANEDVVVAEGEFCSADKDYKIGQISIGRNPAAVIIKTVLDPEAGIWRPTAKMYTLGDAVGAKIPWPNDKLILNVNDSNMDPRIVVLMSELKVVAEGVTISTNPKELINEIFLGRFAAIVKVDLVINFEASLWRPTAEMVLMGDALNANIAWPINRIEPRTKPADEASAGEQVSSREAVMRRSSQSTSYSTSTTKSPKQKCILLDCNNSGRTVAEGKVCSTNPTDHVHHVPLGENVSKVWVEVVKIGEAAVCRPN
ncbi:unnamed protein product [Microthlaspi erraticum]|uniref:Transposase Tnp1/En/Spm-like domain-containing protein n=1 Tax=Microthlaspi erraticum TaxID=1685480 RepID=A0A6D2J1R5_9BRAS|nr:unnamed protein product [Microthlaspi erraticum]